MDGCSTKQDSKNKWYGSYQAGSFTNGCVPFRHTPICFCGRFADSFLYVTGFLS